MAEIKEFLNPKSMLTPGLAGGITMMITNSLWVQFALPQKWTALLVSFLFGAIVFSVKSVPIWQRPIFYLLNSLIIFSMGVGVNTMGYTVASGESSREGTVYLDSNPGNFFDSWLSPAWAQPDDRAEQLDREIEMLERRIQALREERDAMMEEPERHSSPDRDMRPESTWRLRREAEWEAELRRESERPESPDGEMRPEYMRRLPREAEWEAEPRPEPERPTPPDRKMRLEYMPRLPAEAVRGAEPRPLPEPPPKPVEQPVMPPPEPVRTERQFFQGWFR